MVRDISGNPSAWSSPLNAHVRSAPPRAAPVGGPVRVSRAVAAELSLSREHLDEGQRLRRRICRHGSGRLHGRGRSRGRRGRCIRGEGPRHQRRRDADQRAGGAGAHRKALCSRKRLRATTDAGDAIRSTRARASSASARPSLHNGNLDLRYVLQACEDIARAIAFKASAHMLIMRSTILPGAMRRYVIPMLREVSRQGAGHRFRARLSSGIPARGKRGRGFPAPGRRRDRRARRSHGRRPARSSTTAMAPKSTPSISTPPRPSNTPTTAGTPSRSASPTRSARSARRAASMGATVMSVLCADRKLNISPAYLQAGVCLRRLVSAQGSARAALSRQDATTCRAMCSTPPSPPTSSRSIGPSA